MSIHVINDRKDLMKGLSPILGKKLVGLVDGVDCVEMVFSDPDENLVSIFSDGQIAVGFVDSPESYAKHCGIGE